MSSYRKANLDEIAAKQWPHWIPVRHFFGIDAFGVNAYRAKAGATAVPEHDETASDQEEVSVVIRGSGHWRVDGEEVRVREGSFIRFDAGSTRCPVAGPEGMSFISIGSPRGAYTPRGHF